PTSSPGTRPSSVSPPRPAATSHPLRSTLPLPGLDPPSSPCSHSAQSPSAPTQTGTFNSSLAPHFFSQPRPSAPSSRAQHAKVGIARSANKRRRRAIYQPGAQPQVSDHGIGKGTASSVP